MPEWWNSTDQPLLISLACSQFPIKKYLSSRQVFSEQHQICTSQPLTHYWPDPTPGSGIFTPAYRPITQLAAFCSGWHGVRTLRQSCLLSCPSLPVRSLLCPPCLAVRFISIICIFHVGFGSGLLQRTHMPIGLVPYSVLFPTPGSSLCWTAWWPYSSSSWTPVASTSEYSVPPCSIHRRNLSGRTSRTCWLHSLSKHADRYFVRISSRVQSTYSTSCM